MLLLPFAFSLRLLICLEFNRKTLKSSSSEEDLKTLDILSSLIISGWGKLTRGGDRAAKSCLLWHSVTSNGILEANVARFSKNILKLTPSKDE